MLRLIAAVFSHSILAMTFRHDGRNLPESWVGFFFFYAVMILLKLMVPNAINTSSDLLLITLPPLVMTLLLGKQRMCAVHAVSIGISLTLLVFPSFPMDVAEMWLLVAEVVLLYRFQKAQASS